MAISRRKARILALKALFEIDSVGHNPQETIQRVLEVPSGCEEAQFFVTKLVQGVLSHQGSLDETIQAAAPHWPLKQMAGIDKNILRLAIFEILFDNEVPLKVAINEAVELAKIFGGESSPRFVNGVLGTIAPQKINSGEGGQEIWRQCSSE